VVTRATNQPGPDGRLGTADDVRDHTNTTTSFVDQNQTYTSHPSHQVFLREYHMVDGKPLATGHLLTGAHGEGNWGEVKAQAAQMLGIQLTDNDVFNAPLLATDRYGEFLRGPNGFVQLVTTTGLVEGDPSANGGLGVAIPANIVRTDHQFLIDVAHGAAPGTFDDDQNPATPQIALVADADDTLGGLPNPAFDPTQPVGPNNQLLLAQPVGTYDNEMLDRHFVTGDGRGNENIALTAMHSIFHSEHNRLVDDYKQTILESGDVAFLNEWLLTDVTAIPTAAAEIAALNWDGERLFQAGRFVTEMQYQHLVFEEFARMVQPQVDPFIFTNSADINPAIVEEFADVVYRFGHSMLTETVARLDPNLVADDIGLIQAFLNPPEFDKGGVSEHQAIGGIIRGMSRQVGNEIDEFITEALRNNLVGLPLDLAVLNITRARETGAPTFNEARAQFYAMTNDAALAPYTSWTDLAPHLKNPASIINFIAAYGEHSSITSETTFAGKRAAATTLVLGGGTAPTDRVDFLNHTGTWASTETGLNNVDFWIGGLAEAKLEFGGMLGPTFNFVFEAQLEKLQNGDRFYYLSRTQGTNILNELEPNLFSALVMRNSDLGDAGQTTHLPGLLFTTPSYTLEMDQANQRTGIVGPDGVTLNGDPVGDDPILNAINPLVTRVAPGADVNGDGAPDGGVLIW
ncbi:MAG: heme peroxidase, partial [Actinomycetota bacterium]|nr:heme peroxidase [Actinomycetota bacterium]